jgi:hypothetical protein
MIVFFLVRGYDNTSLKVESGVQTNVVHDLLQKRQILMAELNNYTKASHEGHGIPVRLNFFYSVPIYNSLVPVKI